MGWLWEDGTGRAANTLGDFTGFENPKGLDDKCSIRRIVKSQCRTEEISPGKFVRKCQKTEQILKDCVGRPAEIVESNEEHTVEDVSDEVVKGLPPQGGHLDFPGLRSDIEAIERDFFGGLSRFFEAAEEMKKGVFSAFGALPVFDEESSSSSSPSSSRRRGISIDDRKDNPTRTKEASTEPFQAEAGYDLSGLAREV